MFTRDRPLCGFCERFNHFVAYYFLLRSFLFGSADSRFLPALAQRNVIQSSPSEHFPRWLQWKGATGCRGASETRRKVVKVVNIVATKSSTSAKLRTVRVFLGGFLRSLPTPFGSYTEAEDDGEKGRTSVSIKYLYIPSLCPLSQKGARARWAEIIDFGTEIGASFTIRRSLTHRNRLSNCQSGLFFLSHNFISHFLIPFPRTGALPQSGFAILIIGAARIVGII